jgi:hypothetical protein
VTVDFLESASDTNDLTEYTFAGVSLGTASADRLIVVGIAARSVSSTTISSVTIGGVTATVATSGSGAGSKAAIAYATVPTGATGDIVVTFSGAHVRCGIGVWRITGASTTPTDTFTSVTVVRSGTVTIAAGGAALAVCYQNTSATDWTGATEEWDTPSELNASYSGAKKTSAAGEGATITMSGASAYDRLVIASFEPA